MNDTYWLSIGYTGMVVICVFSIFLGSLYLFIKSSYTYIFGEKLVAVVIDYKSYQEEYIDSNDRYKIKTLYIPLLKFKSSKNNILVLESTIHSGNIPIIGEKKSIFYLHKENIILENNFKSFFLTLIGFFFFITFCFFSIALIDYAFGKSMKSYKILF